jgi:hypothetical protein
VPDQAAAALGEAGDLAAGERVRVELVDQVAGGVEQVDLVGRDQRAHGERVLAQVLHDRAVGLGGRVGDGVVAADVGVDAEHLGPAREHLHDRRALVVTPTK